MFMTESSHEIVESSRYILYDRSHMRTREIDLNSRAVMAPKKTDKRVPLMLKQSAFGCFVFERRVGR